MKIVDMRINGYREPLGYELEGGTFVSWKVAHSHGKRAAFEKIEVSQQDEFEEILFQQEGTLSNIETEIDVELEPRTRYFVRVTVTDDTGETAVGKTHFETGKMYEEWEGKWIGPKTDQHVIIRYPFHVSEAVHPRLYITGLGLYEARLNGKKVGNEYLTPGFSDYEKEVQVNTYDLTNLLLEEDNVLEVDLGNGWYKGVFGLENQAENWGDKFGTVFEIRDGDRLIGKSDENATYHPSGVISSGIYTGVEMGIPADTLEETVILLDKLSTPVDRFNLPIVVKKEKDFIEVIHTPKGEIVLDFGQNMAGIIRVKDQQKPGTKLRFHFGEVLQNGNFYNENYRQAAHPFIFEAKGDGQSVEPLHTFFGFRYVKVEGWEGTLHIGDVVALALSSDLPITGSIETSHEGVNRLFQNTMWSQMSNFIDIPTDCPQRDERIGWTGDIQVFSGTASFNMDTQVFFRKFLRHLMYAQKSNNGGIPNYIPDIGYLKGVTTIWGDAGTIIPHTVHRFTGSTSELRNSYSIMKDWVDYLVRWDESDGGLGLIQSGTHFGDWLALDGVSENSFKGGTDDHYLASVYYMNSVELLSQNAAELGLTADQEKYNQQAQKVRQAVMHEYFSGSGRLTVDTQAAYITALRFGLYQDKQKLINQFKARLEKDLYQIKCGFVGATQMCLVMAENGMEEDALRIFLSESYPGWLNCIHLGATTIWERWNSLDQDGKVSPTGMNSFNHYAYGSVVEYMYRQLAGLNELEPGFKKVHIEPKMSGWIPEVCMSYDSVHGKYGVSYQIGLDGTIHAAVYIPFGCEATLKLPEQEEQTLQSGHHEFHYQPDKNVRQVFNESSRMVDFLKSEKAMDMIAEKLPIAYHQLMNKDFEMVMKTVSEYKYLHFLGIQPKDVDVLMEEVSQIKI